MKEMLAFKYAVTAASDPQTTPVTHEENKLLVNNFPNSYVRHVWFSITARSKTSNGRDLFSIFL